MGFSLGRPRIKKKSRFSRKSLTAFLKVQKSMVKVQGFAEMVEAQKKAARKPKLKVGQKGGADARFKIIAKNRGKVKDARDRLVSLNHASGVDARNKPTKIRNLRNARCEDHSRRCDHNKQDHSGQDGFDHKEEDRHPEEKLGRRRGHHF